MNEKASKVRRPRQSRSIQTKEEILKAALALFSEKGFHYTNTKEIASRAGVSTGSFYSYYTDKREVFIEALNVYYQEFENSLKSSLETIELNPDMDRVEFVARFVDSLISAHDVYKELHQELAGMYYSDAEIKKLKDEQNRKGQELTREYMLTWKEELKVTDIEAASVVVFEALNRIVDVVVFSDCEAEFAERIKTGLVHMVSDYLFAL